MWSNMHSTLKRICVTEGLLKVPIHYLRPLILLGVARGGWSRSQRGTPSISRQFISKYRQRFIVKIVGKKVLKKYLVCVKIKISWFPERGRKSV